MLFEGLWVAGTVLAVVLVVVIAACVKIIVYVVRMYDIIYDDVRARRAETDSSVVFLYPTHYP